MGRKGQKPSAGSVSTKAKAKAKAKGKLRAVVKKAQKGVRVVRAAANIAKSVAGVHANLARPKNWYKSFKNPGMVLPGSKYIGPGNRLDLGKPRDIGDAIAYQHDLDYDKLLAGGIKKKNLYRGTSKADDRAIRASRKAVLEKGDPGALAVYLGMGAKKALVHTIGKTRWGKKRGFIVNRDEDFLK